MDCAFKVQCQAHVHRFVLYHQEQRHIYPAGFGGEAIEVGPHTATDGPCIVLFRRVTTHPAILKAWLEGSFLRTTVGRVFWLGSDEASTASTQEELLEKLSRLAAPMAGSVLRLQCEPRSLEGWLADHLPSTIFLHPVNFSHVVHVFYWEGLYRFHMQPAEYLYLNPSTSPSRVPNQLSKAAGKLGEALEVAGFQPEGGVAIDMGAAPGGWTAVLAQRMRHVIAIDPADLDPRALLPNVTHLKCLAEQAQQQLAQLVGSPGPAAAAAGQAAAAAAGEAAPGVAVLEGPGAAAGGDTGAGSSSADAPVGRAAAGEAGPAAGAGMSKEDRGGADLVVCDMNCHPAQMIPLLPPVMACLRPGGLAILTLKFHGHGRDKSLWVEKMAKELGPLGLGEVQLMWLVANTMSERTCIARKLRALIVGAVDSSSCT